MLRGGLVHWCWPAVSACCAAWPGAWPCWRPGARCGPWAPQHTLARCDADGRNLYLLSVATFTVLVMAMTYIVLLARRWLAPGGSAEITINGQRTVDDFHKQLGLIMWEYCGMSRNAEGLKKAKGLIKALRDEFWQNVKVVGTNDEQNQ